MENPIENPFASKGNLGEMVNSEINNPDTVPTNMGGEPIDDLIEAETEPVEETTEDVEDVSEDVESDVDEEDGVPEVEDVSEAEEDQETSEDSDDEPEDPTFSWEEGDQTYEDVPLSVLKRSHINEKLSTKKFQVAAELRKDSLWILDQLKEHPGEAMEQLLGQEQMDVLLNEHYEKRWKREEELGLSKIEDPELRKRYLDGIKAKEQLEQQTKLNEQKEQQRVAEQQAAQQREAEAAVQSQLEETMTKLGVPINGYTINRALTAGASAIELGYDVTIPEIVKQLKVELKKEGLQLKDEKAPKQLPRSNRKTGPTNAKKPRGKKRSRLPTTGEWQEIFNKKFGR